MVVGFDADEPSSCPVCRTTAESFAPYHESRPGYWRLKLGNPIALRDQTSCSTCQKLWNVLLDYESRYLSSNKTLKREYLWPSDDVVQIKADRRSGYRLGLLRRSFPSESPLTPTCYLILRLRPHIVRSPVSERVISRFWPGYISA
jgi:hypothetical protein